MVGGDEGDTGDRQLLDALRSHPALLFLEARLSDSLKKWRAEEAARLLRYTDEPIKRIAARGKLPAALSWLGSTPSERGSAALDGCADH